MKTIKLIGLTMLGSATLFLSVGAAFADSISFTDDWKDSDITEGGVITTGTQDTGTLNASLTVPGFANLSLTDLEVTTATINFGDFSFSEPFGAADSSTANSATFLITGSGLSGGSVNVGTLTFSRSGNVLTISGSINNNASTTYPQPIIADQYRLLNSTIAINSMVQDQQPLTISLSGPISYNLQKTIYITGTSGVSFDNQNPPNFLYSVKVSGSADYTAPSLSYISPTAGAQLTNGLVTVQVRATDVGVVSNVEFYLNGQDFGPGLAGPSNLWTMNFALTPGANIIQTVATDDAGNSSPTNVLQLTYEDKQTNADLIAFSDHWLDTVQSDQFGDTNVVTQDTGLFNVAQTVSGLQSLSASTWSNLIFTISFGDINFSNSLSAAFILTANKAMFINTKTNPDGNLIVVSQLNVSRSGDVLTITGETGNPTDLYPPSPIIADLYLGLGGPIQDQQPFTLTLQDGNTFNQYASIAKTIFINGTDATNADSLGDKLNDVQVSGAADYTAPTITITTPTSGLSVSNAAFTVTGKAADNVAVASVFCSVANSAGVGAWTLATGTTNWSAAVSLAPGTNTVSVYAVDTSGNHSPTNSQKMVYVLSAPITLNIVGKGTVSGAVNGQLLAIGKSVTLTATPGPGDVLTNWLVQVNGSTVLSTNKAVPFQMESNLVLTVTFADVTPPTITITTPTSGLSVSNAAFTVTGKAADNVAVASVFCSVANSAGVGAWTLATGTTNWSAAVSLAPGTNTVSVYAVDTSGNHSPTNSQKMVYVLSAPITLNIVGKGTVSGAVNGQLLAIGKSVTLTATPGPGDVLTNWLVQVNGSTVLSTNKAVPFQMESNLVLTVTFADVTPPTITITTPTSGLSVSNAAFTVTGKAADNVAVASVFCSVANSAGVGAWTLATGTTNWSAAVSLAPGTNTVSVYAVDTSGNHSPTNSQKMVYVLSAPITLNIVGKGTVSGAVNGQLLAIGKSVTLTATPGPGDVLTNWLVQVNGSTVLSTNKAVPFQMESNLVLTVTFADVTPPTITITTPTSGLSVSNAAFTVTGKAADNVAVASVFCSVANSAGVGAWTLATGTTNWSAAVSLAPGTNTVSVYAVDTSGNHSPTNSQKMVYVLSAPITLNIVGKGTVSGAVNGQLLAIGKSVTLTATPGPGDVLTNWLVQVNGSTVLSTNKAVPFQMESNLVLTVTFADVTPPTITITTPTSGLSVSNAAFTVTGKAADNVAVASVFCSVANSAGVGAWTLATGTTNWSAAVSLAPGTNTVSVYAVDTSGNHSPTNSQKMVYVLSAPITLNIVGKGTVSGAVNGQLLAIGKSVTLTATPGPGDVLTNWLVQVNGSTVLSTNKAVPFQMESNLVLTVTFADVTPPTITITTPTSGLSVSNAAFTVTGKAADNVAVASVFCSVANSAGVGAWTLATGTTNWSAAVSLAPGTNTVSVYAVDTSGNHSPTNSQKMVYVLSAPITLNIVGKGTVSGAVNGQLLAIGKSVTLTATPGPGDVLTNWLVQVNGSTVLSTNKAVPFQMESNLVLTVTFADVTPPTITITTPTSGLSVSNAAFTVTGKAADNVAVASVFCSVANSAGVGAWTLATGTTNWSAAVSLAPGTNTVSVYAVDTSGLNSKVITATVVRVSVPTVFQIYQNATFHNPQAEVAFDGNNYLVAFQTEESGSGIPTAQLVSQSGNLAAPLLQIPVMGGADPPKVDFDGTNYLMTWSDPQNSIEGPGIHGQLIDTNGAAIGSRFLINQSTTVDNYATTVFGGGVHFLMWADSREANITGSDDIYGAMVAPDGSLAVSDFEISAGGGQDEAGQGTAGFDGTNFLATWGGAAGHYSVNGRLISPAGNFITESFNIYTNSSLPAGLSLNCVAFDGTKYLVLFTVGAGSGSASTWHIQGRFVTTAGEVLTNQISITTDAGPQIVPCATFDGTHYLITWNQGFDPFNAGSSGSIMARYFDVNGNPTTAEFKLFAPANGQTALWAPVLFDGSQYFSVGGLGHMLTPAPNLTFTNGILNGAFLSP